MFGFSQGSSWGKLPPALANGRWIARVEWALAILVSVMVIALIIVRITCAGAMWRDQCGTTQLALMPLGELLDKFHHQTLPPLLPLIYRLYLKVVGIAEPVLHAFRLNGAIGLIVAAWIGARMNAKQAPLFFLTLFGLNSFFLYWAGYALTAASIAPVLFIGAGVILQPSRGRILGLGGAALISAQLLINNLLLVVIVMISGILACLIRPAYKLALVFTGVLIVCVISDLYYLHVYAAADWRIVLKQPTTFASLWPEIRAVFGEPQAIMLYLWSFIFAAGLAAAAWALSGAWRRGDWPRSRLSILVILTALLAPIAYCLSFVLNANIGVEARHFLPMVAILAAGFDIVVAHFASHRWIRLARIALTAVALFVMPFASWPMLTQRQTNIDIVARKLEQEAGRNDLIVVNPWSLGISFQWYYHGAARWLTLPNISDHQIHRYDLLKEKMMSASPIEDVKREIGATLQRGHRVWVVGSLYPPDQPGLPLFPFPAPDPDFGWQHMIYREAWAQQLRDFVARRAIKANCLINPSSNVYSFENVPLWVVEGESQ